MNIKKIFKDKGIYVIAFLIPWILILIHSVVRDGWLMGHGTILRGDAGIQYYQLYVELWNKVHSGRSLFYSWNAGGGFDFYQNMAYYLISPFTLLTLIVPKAWLMDAVQAVMILKWSCIYVSMLYYFMHTRYNRIMEYKKLLSFVLAGIYTLSNCILYYIAYFNWNDVLIIFPLLLLMIERMVVDCSWKRYYLLLFMAIVCNFYMAYQVCIFLVIWFVFQLRRNTKDIIKKFGIFIGSSLLAGISSSVILLPCLAGGLTRYSGDETKSVSSIYMRTMLVTFWNYVKKLFIFDDISNVDSLDPRAYISVGAVILLILYLGVKSELKIRNIVIFMFLFSGVFVGLFSYAWHGFSMPHGIAHRQLYILVFMTAFIIMDMLQNHECLNMMHIVLSCLVEGIIFVITFFKIEQYQEPIVYIVTMSLFAIYQIILVLYMKKSITNKQIVIIFSVLIMGELSANAYFQLDEYNVKPFAELQNTGDAERLNEQIHLKPGERLNVVNGLTNDGLLFDKASNDIFLSYCNGNTVGLYKALGMDYSDDAFCVPYGASPLLNVLFNQRYGISDRSYAFSDELRIAGSGALSLYEIQRLAGLGYMTSDVIEMWNPYQLDPFNAQNQFAYLATGVKGVYDIVYPDVVCRQGDDILEVMEGHENEFVYEYTEKEVKMQNIVTMEAVIPEDMDLYLMIRNNRYVYSRIWVDDEEVTNVNESYMQRTYHLGKVKKGQVVKVATEHEGEFVSDYVWYEFGEFHEDVFQEVYEKLSGNVYEIESMRDAYVDGHIHAEWDGVMVTSIQAMDVFSVYVDGDKTAYKKIGDAFIGVPLKEGEHRVEFRFVPPFFHESLIISMGGILVFILLYIIDRRKGIMVN